MFIAEQILNVFHDVLEERSLFFWKNRANKAPRFSFEIVNIDGKIRFLFVCPREYKTFVTNQFYAHYPHIDIQEREDYLVKKGVYVTDLGLKDLFYVPIKTYSDFSERSERDNIDPCSALTSSLVKQVE